MKLAYKVYDPPVGNGLSPIIFLHCTAETKRTWTYVAPAVAKNTRRKVYTLDARNHGESPRSEEMNFDVMVDDLEEFLHDNNIPKATLVGHSMGGRVAIMMALKKPKMVEKLVIEDMTPGVIKLPSRTPLLLQTFKSILSIIPPGLNASEAKKFLADFVFSTIPLYIMPKDRYLACNDNDMVPLKKIGNEYQFEVNTDALERFYNSYLQDNFPLLTGVYSGDALFLFGSRPLFKLDKDDSIPRFFPRAVIKKFEDAGHYIHNEFLEQYVKCVSDFINDSNQQIVYSRL